MGTQQIKANPEDRLSTAFVGLEEDRPVFRLPFTGRVGERKSHGQHSEKLADPVGVKEVGVLELKPRVLVAAKSVSIAHRRRPRRSWDRCWWRLQAGLR